MIDFPALRRANAPLNAFIDFDEAATGGEGTLAELTIGIKANIAVAGLPWTAGMELHRHRIAERDAEVVAKLRKAGAIIVGTLNMEEAALGSKTDNPWFGATHNAHRIGHSPGGSSGGSGAAVAAGLCDAALGTDTMGSIRIPAAHNGVYGFKPATARVGQDGIEPADATLDAAGPLARDLAMLERVARAMSDFGEGAIAGRGTTLIDHGVEIDAEVFNAFCKCPADVTGVSLDWPLSRVRFAGFVQVARAMAAHLDGADATKLSDRLKRLISYGPRRGEADWAEDWAILAGVRDRIRAAVAEHGFLLLPTTPNPPFAHGEEDPAHQADFTCLASIAGLPALSLPMGWTVEGLPLGVQLVCQAGHEAGLFALAREFDKGLDAYRPPATFGY